MKTGKPQMIMYLSSIIKPCFYGLLALAGVAVYVSFCRIGEAEPFESKSDVDVATLDWRVLSPEVLRKPGNELLQQQVRTLAAGRSHRSARIALIRLGDQDFIQGELADLRSEHPIHRNNATNQLMIAANPDIIVMLKDDLNKEEPDDRIFIGDISTYPVSFLAATIVGGTVVNSQSFSPEVKEWFSKLPRTNAAFREKVRAWVASNLDALMRGDYQAAIPLP